MQRPLEVLHRKQQRHQHKKAKQRAKPHTRHHPDRRTPARAPRLLTQMRRRIKPREGILRQQRTTHRHVRGTRPAAPPLGPFRASTVMKPAKDEGRRLVGGRLGEHGYAQGRDARAVQRDGDVVEVAQDAHAESVDDGVGEEQGRVDADGDGGGRGEGGVLEGDGRGDEVGEAEGYAGGYGYLGEGDVVSNGDGGGKGR